MKNSHIFSCCVPARSAQFQAAQLLFFPPKAKHEQRRSHMCFYGSPASCFQILRHRLALCRVKRRRGRSAVGLTTLVRLALRCSGIWAIMWHEIALGWFTKTVVSCHARPEWADWLLLCFFSSSSLYFFPLSFLVFLPLTRCAGIGLLTNMLECISNQMLGGNFEDHIVLFGLYCLFFPSLPCRWPFPTSASFMSIYHFNIFLFIPFPSMYLPCLLLVYLKWFLSLLSGISKFCSITVECIWSQMLQGL